MPTIDDVARIAGVSNATVSRNLNRVESISLVTKTRINDAIERLNFPPNKFATALLALSYYCLHIPNDVLVIGYDGLELTAFLPPSLTTVQQPVEGMGRPAAQLAVEHLQETPREGVIALFKPKLLVGDSVGGVMSP